jgi:hypothetical protein
MPLAHPRRGGVAVKANRLVELLPIAPRGRGGHQQPLAGQEGEMMLQIASDRTGEHDQTAGDAVEQNQLLKGISNLVTTRSDVFTVWLRIRTIKQDPLTGQWNGTDPEFIIDDSRYMMTVDRSSVDRPGEQPRIVSFVKVSN